jgi:hypothetical protein
MADLKLWQLIQALAERTKDGRVPWRPAVRDGSYVASFVNYSVEIAPNQRGETLDYVLRVYNSDGDVIEESSDVELRPVATEEPFAYMRTLYESARRTAFGADKAIDALLRELTSE